MAEFERVQYIKKYIKLEKIRGASIAEVKKERVNEE